MLLALTGGACSAASWADVQNCTDGAPTDALAAPDLGCADGRLTCNGECVDPQSNQKNCGVCNLRCQIGMDICLFGKCSPCAAGLNCNNMCTKPYTDRNNCGACFIMCTVNQNCVNGSCVP